MNSIKCGEVYMATLEKVSGSVQHGYRPVVIIQNNKGNLHSPTTIIVPITTKKQNKDYIPTHVRLNKMAGLKQGSVAMCEQIITIDKSNLHKRVGKLNRRKMKEIKEAIYVSVISTDEDKGIYNSKKRRVDEFLNNK